jgi:hypothetical protein
MTNSWKHNPYYNPQECGLEIVAEIDFDDDYGFDKVVVWKTLKGKFVWACDSGCSCPCPFEDYHDMASLEKLTNWKYFETTVNSMSRGKDTEKFLREVQTILNGG